VFAPSDKAFARIPEKCLDALLKNKTLLTSKFLFTICFSILSMLSPMSRISRAHSNMNFV